MAFPDPMTNISDFVAMFFGAKLLTDVRETDVTISNAVSQFLSNNPRRVALHISNTSGQAFTIAWVNTLTANTGRQVAPGETLSLYWYNELREIEKPIFALTISGTAGAHLREIFFV